MSDREMAPFRNYRDARESLKRLRDYIDRKLEDYDYPTDLICHIANIRRNINEWAGQKWCAAVDEVMETRIDCESVRLAAA